MSSRDVDRWIDEHAIVLEPGTYEAPPSDEERIEAVFGGAQVVFLGETNHFVHEKADFRLWWLRRLAAGRRLVVGEELSWSDGRDVARYLAGHDDTRLERLATFGDVRHQRDDRDDTPQGIFKASHATYPTKLFKAEQVRFYREARALGITRFFGFDIDAPGTGYDDVLEHRTRSDIPAAFWDRLARVHGESLESEARRLESAAQVLPADAGEIRVDLEAMIGSLRYTALVNPARDYEALRPAMALRENLMKRHVGRVLRELRDDETLVLMAHAFHLAKDDRAIQSVGVGPGGDRVPSLGHHLVHELGIAARSIWMVYGAGEDSQPLPDLPRRASYPRGSLNARMGRRGVPLVVPVASAPQDTVGVGHLYNSVTPVRLAAQADAVFFIPRVSPLQA